ncbi:MAG: type transport system permease protein [Miltoncostaeaceae bacterium]|nr:type transport system permease protein [Miltoncostaeaceae bacterium]
MRKLALVLGKDLRQLRRGPGLLLALVVYPLLVALIVAAALQSDERRPAIAVVNLDGSGRTVEVAGERFSVEDYLRRLGDEVTVRELGAGAADRALRDGRVSAVLTIPDGFIADLQSSVRRPALTLDTGARDPIEGAAIRRRLEAAVFRINQRLAQEYVDQVLRLVDLVLDGGRVSVFGLSGEALGLKRSLVLVERMQRELRSAGEGALADRLDRLVTFINLTSANLGLARPAAEAIRSPIELREGEVATGREPLSAFGFAGALLVSLGLAGALLAAAALSSERDDNAMVRLRRGLVSPAALVGAKVLSAAIACAAVGAALLGGVALLTSLTVGRWAWWVLALVLAGLAFGAFGVLVGAIARDTRTALLAALMAALPLLALAMLPDGGVAGALAALVPFGPAFHLFQSLLADPELTGSVGWGMAHLAALAAVFGGAAAVAVGRRPAA